MSAARGPPHPRRTRRRAGPRGLPRRRLRRDRGGGSARPSVRFANNTVTTNGTRPRPQRERDRLSARPTAGQRSAPRAAAAPPTSIDLVRRAEANAATAQAGRGRRAARHARRSRAPRRVRRAAGDDEPGRARRRARGPRRRLRPGRRRRDECWRASPSTRSRRSTSARRPVFGFATWSRRASSRSSPAPTGERGRPGRGPGPRTSPRSTSRS